MWLLVAGKTLKGRENLGRGGRVLAGLKGSAWLDLRCASVKPWKGAKACERTFPAS
jgi:hypothetical protein